MAEVAPHEPMAAVSDSATISDHPPPRIPTKAANSSDELRRWADYAVAQAISVKQVLGATADSAITTAGSGLSHLRSTSLHGLDEAKSTLELSKNQYATYENLAIEKIKESVFCQIFLMIPAIDQLSLTKGSRVGMQSKGLLKCPTWCKKRALADMHAVCLTRYPTWKD